LPERNQAVIFPIGKNMEKPAPPPSFIALAKIRSVKDLGDVVRQRRREIGLTQIDAAGLVGVGPRFLGELENGKKTLAIGKVLQTLEGLGLTLEIGARRG
jgi:HTH-type transcriptional regulator / antitoxin HipB